jgi:hypothetical protein
MNIDWQEMCSQATRGLNRKEAKRVAKALDIAIAFGAIEHATGNESLQDVPTVLAAAVSKMDELRRMS